MIVNFSSVFTETGVSFKVSHKVYKLLMDNLTNLKLQAILPKNKSNRDGIGFLISTYCNSSEIKVFDPTFPNRSRFVDIQIELPFLDIKDRNEYLSVFLYNLEKACLLGFQKLGIEDQRIAKIFSIVKKDILNNSLYDYKEPFIPEINL
jgi:hypothetical protein